MSSDEGGEKEGELSGGVREGHTEREEERGRCREG